MDIPNVEPNSHKYNQEKETKQARKPKPINLSGGAKKKKRSLADRFRDTFVKEDPKAVGKYIIQEVIIPALIDNVQDILISSFEMTFRGEASRRNRTKSGIVTSLGSKINYGGFFSNGEKEKMPKYSHSDMAHNFDNICFESRGDAELVLDHMVEILSEYRQVSVAEFYELSKLPSDFTDYDFGWKDLSSAKVDRCREGYYIVLPKCVSLK